MSEKDMVEMDGDTIARVCLQQGGQPDWSSVTMHDDEGRGMCWVVSMTTFHGQYLPDASG